MLSRRTAVYRVSRALPSTALWLLSSCSYPLCPKSLPPELEEAWSMKSLKRRDGCCCVCKRQDDRSTIKGNSLGKWICNSGYYFDFCVCRSLSAIRLNLLVLILLCAVLSAGREQVVFVVGELGLHPARDGLSLSFIMGVLASK